MSHSWDWDYFFGAMDSSGSSGSAGSAAEETAGEIAKVEKEEEEVLTLESLKKDKKPEPAVDEEEEELIPDESTLEELTEWAKENKLPMRFREGLPEIHEQGGVHLVTDDMLQKLGIVIGGARKKILEAIKQKCKGGKKLRFGKVERYEPTLTKRPYPKCVWVEVREWEDREALSALEAGKTPCPRTGSPSSRSGSLDSANWALSPPCPAVEGAGSRFERCEAAGSAFPDSGDASWRLETCAVSVSEIDASRTERCWVFDWGTVTGA
eukprot:symbB.v1.2.033822.t1/scaffold4249.1/size57077/2